MKNFKNFMVRLFVLICMQAICFFIVAQPQQQIVGTSEGKYGIITTNKPWQKGDTIILRLSVQWVDENFKPIEDSSSVVILHKDNLMMSQQDFVECINFRDRDFICFNRHLDLKFEIDNEIIENTMAASLDFDFSDKAGLADYRDKNAFLLKQPRNFTVNYTVNPALFVKVIPTPPTIELVSPELDEEGRAFTQKSEIEVSVKATDESGINLVTIDSKDAVALAGGIYKSIVKLIRFISWLWIMTGVLLKKK
jgi:hypothetical protein